MSFSAAWMASHSLLATTPRKPLSQTTLAPGMSLIEFSSTFIGTAPATEGRIIRPCTMPGTLTSVQRSSGAEDFRRDVGARHRLADDLVVLGTFGFALPGA